MVRGGQIYLSTYFTSEEEYFTMRRKEGAELVICSEVFPSEVGWQAIANETIMAW
jgi:hypothetical protein